MMEHAIEVSHLQKKFHEFTLDDVSFVLPKGYIMGLVGKNGAGKTTIIKLILELLQKDHGSIQLFGEDRSDSIDCKQDIAVVFDELYFVDDWSIKDVESAISPFYTNWDTAMFHQCLKRFEVPMDKLVKELSKGMKMKLMLAVAFSHKAKLLILDEPTSGLDPVARDELLDMLLEFIEDEGNSVLFSTHITTDLEKVADYLTIVHNGRVFYTGNKDELFEKYCIVKGGLDALSKELESKCIGIQKGSTGFSALLDVLDMKYVSKDVVIEPTSIDDILIHVNVMEREGCYHDN